MPAPTILKIVRSFSWNMVSLTLYRRMKIRKLDSYMAKGIEPALIPFYALAAISKKRKL